MKPKDKKHLPRLILAIFILLSALVWVRVGMFFGVIIMIIGLLIAGLLMILNKKWQ